MLGSNVYQALPKMFKSNFEKTLVMILKDEHGLKTKVTDHLESSEKAKILEILEKYIYKGTQMDAPKKNFKNVLLLC